MIAKLEIRNNKGELLFQGATPFSPGEGMYYRAVVPIDLDSEPLYGFNLRALFKSDWERTRTR